ncbi:MAG: hypothetical protein L0210_00715 [Rhodospirillales bacterium]|nr:hypothetical protein [Rhodospirillales bacterium]
MAAFIAAALGLFASHAVLSAPGVRPALIRSLGRSGFQALIYRITRFPGSTGLLIWAGLHLAATGDLRRVVLFATMAAIALFAILKNDWVLRRADSSEARGFRAATSVVPFAAIIAGRQRLASGEIGWRFPVVALLPYAALLLAHPLLFEVDPLDRLR